MRNILPLRHVELYCKPIYHLTFCQFSQCIDTLYVKSLYYVSAFRRPSGVVRFTSDTKVKFYEPVAVLYLHTDPKFEEGGE
jgi:hypothetical protein